MISQEPLHTEIYMKNAQNADTHFVRAYAVETHVKISYAALFTNIYRQQVAEESEPPWSSTNLRIYRQNPSV